MKGDIINGNPYRAFAYLYFGLKSTTTFSFSFKATNHNSVYSKIFFWGDGSNILGILPSNKFCFMPSGDDPPPSCKAEHECLDNKWYRVEMDVTTGGDITLRIDGKGLGTGNVQSIGAARDAMMGVYHWARKKPSPYELHFRDMCFGVATDARLSLVASHEFETRLNNASYDGSHI